MTVGTATVTAQGPRSRSTRRTRGEDFYLATSGDLHLAINEDFPMAMDSGEPPQEPDASLLAYLGSFVSACSIGWEHNHGGSRRGELRGSSRDLAHTSHRGNIILAIMIRTVKAWTLINLSLLPHAAHHARPLGEILVFPQLGL